MKIARLHTSAVVAAGAVLALAGCGGSSHHSSTVSSKLVPKGAVASALPARAKAQLQFASDEGVSTPASSAHITGTIVASIPFNPATDGFAFQNYGFIAGTEIDAHAMRELFGNGVCATAPSDSCTLTPAAQQVAAQFGTAGFGGHCYGFSQTALRFFQHNLSPSSFGGSTVYSLSLTPQLQDEIAAAFVTQELPDVQRQMIFTTPMGIVRRLEQSFAHPNGPLYTLMVQNPAAHDGHAITPIGIDSLGNNQYEVLVYDNNFPGVTRALAVNGNSDSWSYTLFTVPGQPATTWSGQGNDSTIGLVPVSTTEHTHPCTFCSGASVAHGTDTISLSGNPDAHAHLLITNAKGQRVGFVGNRLVNQIAGARVIQPLANELWKTSAEPVYLVPAGQKLTITLAGGDPTGHDAAQVHVTGPGFGATVDNLMPTTGSAATITLLPGGSNLSVKLTGATTAVPTLQLARDRGKTGNLAQVTPHRLAKGSTLSVAVAPTGKQVHVASSSASTPVTVSLHQVSSHGTSTGQHTVAVAPGQSKTLSLGLIQVG